MRIVLDTNILARAAARTPGPARELLLRCLDSPHVLLLSEFLLAEVTRALQYPRMRKVHGLGDEDIADYVNYLKTASVTVLLPEGTSPAVVRADTEDDPIVATAVVGLANVLCSRDHHLYQPQVVAYCRARGVEVMNDLDLLNWLRKGGEGAEIA